WFLFVSSYRSEYLYCFFFSSRRRHTRFKCDWSSDVCSSDLGSTTARPWPPSRGSEASRAGRRRAAEPEAASRRDRRPPGHRPPRSEERRVGKEGGTRRAKNHQEK